jgi:ankyrin repeat protein
MTRNLKIETDTGLCYYVNHFLQVSMSLSLPFNGKAFPWRKQALEKLIEADDASGLEAFLKKHPRAVEWELVHGPNHHLYIHEAVENGKCNAARVLLKQGARTDTLSQDGNTLLEHALNIVWNTSSSSSPDHLRMAQLLIDHGADVNGVDRHQRTNLMQACWMGNVEAAKFLLAHGADPALKRDEKSTLLTDTLMRRGSCIGIMKVILSTKPDVDEKNGVGRAPLNYAKEPVVAQMLLDAGADPSVGGSAATEGLVGARLAARLAEEAVAAAKERDRQIDDICHGNVPVHASRTIVFKKRI